MLENAKIVVQIIYLDGMVCMLGANFVIYQAQTFLKQTKKNKFKHFYKQIGESFHSLICVTNVELKRTVALYVVCVRSSAQRPVGCSKTEN